MDREKVRRAGVDYQAGLERLMGNETLFDALLLGFSGSELLDKAAAALARDDYEAFFVAMHTLKGTSGNLAIRGMHEACAKTVDCLRAKDYPAAKEHFARAKAEFETFRSEIAGC